MPPEATQTGASQTIHDRLTAILDADEATPDTEAKPAKEVKEVEQKVEQDKDDTDAASTEVETETEAPESESTAEETKVDNQETDAPKEPVTNLRQLAEHLGIEYDQLLDSIHAETKIDGEDGAVPLSKVIKSYQLEGHLNRKSMELSDAKKAFEQDAQTKRQQYEHGLDQLNQSLTLANQMLQGEYAQINWGELEKSEPLEYLKLRTKFEDRQKQLLQSYQLLQQEEQKRQSTQTQAFTSMIEDEGKKLLNSIPEWKDTKVKQRDKDATKDYLRSRNYSDEEIGQVYDHRLVLIVRDAMRYRDLQNKKTMITKKVNEAPKLAKPGSPKSQSDTERAAYQDQLKSLKKTGKIPKGLLERFV